MDKPFSLAAAALLAVLTLPSCEPKASTENTEVTAPTESSAINENQKVSLKVTGMT